MNALQRVNRVEAHTHSEQDLDNFLAKGTIQLTSIKKKRLASVSNSMKFNSKAEKAPGSNNTENHQDDTFGTIPLTLMATSGNNS
jgi:hypothetical protein